ncbi:MAG: diguanylate cyclase [Deltaproteobacteria bacterium]|nr:diguanylate cyclase [Deltaproteobacteria bacterium]
MNIVKKNALIIESNPIAIKFLSHALKSLGFEVAIKSALSQNKEDWLPTLPPTVLVMDTEALGIDTKTYIEFLDTDNANHKTPIVVISKESTDRDIKRAFDAAEIRYVQRPMELPAFQRTVNDLLGWNRNQRVAKRSPALIVEDVNTTAMIVQKLLDVLGVESIICHTVAEFDAQMDVIYPEIISLDLYLPDGNGLEICKKVRSLKEIDELPIVIVSGNTEMDTVVECLRAGANDHISKPIIKEEFFARVSNVLKIRALQKSLQDQQKMMETLAFTDPLTNLFNRTYMDMALRRETERTRRSNSPLGLLLIDLDSFKKVNDTHGHETGDEVLREFGFLLRKKIRSYDVPCRFGGEEFCVLLPGSTAANVVTVAERIRKACEESTFSAKQLKQTISIGTSVFPELSVEQNLITDADKALYSAKQGGRNRTIVSLPK